MENENKQEGSAVRMTGLEKIIDQILADAKNEADSIVKDAQTEAQKILTESEKQSDNAVLEIQKKSKVQAENLKNRMHSSNDLYRRTQTLAVKQEVIAQIIEKAYREVCSLDTEQYFGMLEKMIEKYALAQSGKIYFSDKDLKAMPKGFEEKIRTAAQKAGGKLELSGEGKNIENGFILSYKGIDENCTIKAIFDAYRDEMQDTVYALLYGKEA